MLWMTILGKGGWFLKITMITICTYFSLAFYMNLAAMSGWPSDASLPKRFQFHGALVREPSRDQKDGVIIMWVTEVDQTNTPMQRKKTFFNPFTETTSEPRSIRKNYDRQMHEAMEDGNKRLREGQTVIMGVDGQNDLDETRKGGKKGGSLSQDTRIVVYDLPPLLLPPKISQSSP
jgi:hypothetical protein